MEFNFDTKKTLIARALAISSSPIFNYSSLLSQTFFYLVVIVLLFSLLSFFGLSLASGGATLAAVMLFLCLFFLEIHLFSEVKVKKPVLGLRLSDALADEGVNLAEFLSLEGCAIVQGAIKMCKKRKLPEISSEALLYAALSYSKDIQILMGRLGVDVKKMQTDVKNYLEKSRPPRASAPAVKNAPLPFSESFQETIRHAATVASQRSNLAAPLTSLPQADSGQMAQIGAKELMVGLANYDEFLKKMLVQQDLKETDVENITLWLMVVEQKIEANKRFWTRQNLWKKGSLARDWLAGFTVVLDRFSIDFRRLSKKHAFAEIVGHQEEIEETETVLAKSSLSNVLLVGE